MCPSYFKPGFIEQNFKYLLNYTKLKFCFNKYLKSKKNIKTIVIIRLTLVINV